ncbi:MAG: hypothetical protein IKK51_09585 [Oscillospiraceae bacterium]|nr:hypothetical protein [Oscillospiraceae bacterium]MBR6616700.1 hypothetical protein [Oscillospiraceae bacterium]
MWIFTVFLSLLADNLIFTKALGTSTLMAASKSRSNLLILSLMMSLFSVAGCMLTTILYWSIPLLRHESVMVESLFSPILYTAVISVIYIVVLLLLYALSGKWFSTIKKYVHLSAFNCAVMGVMHLCFAPERFLTGSFVPTDFLGMSMPVMDARTVYGSLLFGIQMGLGFLLASLFLLAVRKRLYAPEVPAAFRGFPAILVYIGLLSMAIHAITV